MLFVKEFWRPVRLVAAVILSLFVTVPVANNSSYVQFIDVSLTGDVQRHETTLFYLFYRLVSLVCSPKAGVIWILLIAFLMWGFKYKIQSLWALGTVLGGDAIDEIIKHLIKRPRPSFHPAIDTGYSFPSGHVFSTFLIAVVLWFVVIPQIQRQGLRIAAQFACWLVVIIVMLARIYLNAHYPTDTVGALLYGYAWLQICEYLYLWIGPRLKKYKLTRRSYL